MPQTTCPDCSAEITCAEITRPDGSRFITVLDADLAAQVYRPEQGYAVRAITGRRCDRPANHY